MAAKTAIERLDQIVAEHPRSPASTHVTITLGDARDIRARLAMLDALLADLRADLNEEAR